MRLALLTIFLFASMASVSAAACRDNMPEYICLMEDVLPFEARERWLEKDAYYFANKEKIERRRRIKTVMVFTKARQPITDLELARKHADRLAKRGRCDITEGPALAKPTAYFVLSCPL